LCSKRPPCSATKKVERLYLYPAFGLWPMLFRNITLTTGKTVRLTDIAKVTEGIEDLEIRDFQTANPQW
jgi:hypothetical protein